MNNYEILQLSFGATKSEIKQSYRRLSKLYHPDKTGGDSLKFIQIQQAYEELIKTPTLEFQSDVKKETEKATYRFISIKKTDDYYILSYHLNKVYTVEIKGKDYNSISTYELSGENRQFNLKIDFKDMKLAKYQIFIYLLDNRGNYGKESYKIKPPHKGIRKLIYKIFGK